MERGAPLPLSFAQQRLWFLEQLGGVGAAYHIPKGLRLRGELDREALRRALDRIVARHEALRTTFAEVDGEPVQQIAPVAGSGFHLLDHDLGEHPDPEGELSRLAASEAAAPFDLERGPLIRGRLIRLGMEDHALLLTMHHIVSDGWSMDVLTRELSALYGAFVRGEPDPLPPLPVQYADYAVWQRRRVSGEVLRGQAEYWKQTLSGAPELMELPADRTRPVRQDFAGAAVATVLETELTSSLKALGQRHETTLFMTLLAGWSVVLGRLSGGEDVIIGTPLANRAVPEIGGLIGFFVNTVALRVGLSGSPTVAELLGRVKERVLDAQHHQDIPFEQVVELVQPARSLGHSPLVQVMFSLQNMRESKMELPGLTLVPLRLTASGTAKVDLSLGLFEAGERIVGGLAYATSLFERETVERWLTYLRNVLEGFAADDGRPVERLALMPESERRLVVEEWNRTEAEYPGEACIHELFERQVARTPEAVAVVFGGEHLTYAELERRANQLAHSLRGRGVGPEDRVALCMERSPELMVAFLGILKAGAAYVALEPAHPADRLAYMLQDSGARLLLTQSRLLDRLPEARPETLCLDRMAEELAAEPAERPESGVRPENLAYIYYTSGSTGRPKGVVMHHYGPVNYFAWARGAYLSHGGRGAPVFSSMTVDLTLANFVPLFAGQPVELLPEGPGVEALAEALRRAPGYAMIKITPTHLSLLNQLLAPEDAAGAAGTLVIGADNLMAEPTLFWREHAPAVRLLNEYGPTETVVGCSLYAIPPGRHGEGRVPFGRPIQNLTHYVLDARMQPVPVGVPGELYIGGVGVARGYLGRPGLSAEKFVPDPFSARPGARFYRTGDRARWLPDGNLEFLGRIDFQVKVRGYRIELGEIEARLAEHAGVREAVVLAREDVPGERRLVAYVVGEETAGAEVLRAHLGETLPAYMVPAAYVRLEQLPLGSTGKLDRKALPAPEGDAFARRGYEAPVGETEAALTEIWADVLRVERVGRWDHFFDLGGHSLLAVRVISRVRQALGVEISVGELFTRPVLRDFARELETAARAELPPIGRAAREGRLPLSFAQQRLWFLEQLGGLGSAYHIPSRHRLRGELDRAALVRALDGIVARHEALRTTFAQVDGVPEQRIAPAEASGFHLVEHDLSGTLPLSARNERGGGRGEGLDAAAELGRLVLEEGRAPFDLERGPLIRGRLIRLAADDHVLLLTMHHIVSDGWSMEVLFGELSALYAAQREGREAALPELPVQYADYAVWQRRWVEGEVLREQADYWTRTLAGAPELLELHGDYPRPAQMDPAGARLGVELDEALTAGLKALSRRHGTTLFMTLLAGWAAVLSRLSGQDDVVIGTPAANRGQREIEGLIGFFVNTLALRLDLSGAPTVAELLVRVKERALAAQHRQDIPFEQVVELVDPVRSLAHTPLFQVMFAWQHASRAGGLSLPGLEVGGVGGGASQVQAKVDLSLSLWETGDRIAGSVTYATALFARESVKRWAGYLRRVLEEMVADESRPVERLALMPESERRLVVEEWNRTEAEHPGDACVHELFEAQVARTPEAVAVVFEGEHLTYAELNRRANRLAHHLAGLGVGPDVPIGLCVEPGVELMVGVLGVLKAGGGYVPLDPSYPEDRLAYMLADGAPAVLLTAASLRNRFDGVPVPVLCLDADARQWAGRPTANPARGDLRPDHLAYVIYTSGSTGRPKGVRVEHGALAATLAAAGRAFGFGADDRAPSLASFAFDIWLFEFLLPLLSGGSVRLFPRERVLAVPRLVEELAACTVLHAVPVLMRRIVQEVRATPAGVLPGLRRAFVGGDAVAPDLLEEMRAAFPAAEINVLYGPTEATIICAAHRLGGEPASRQMVGRPLGNAALYVLLPGGDVAPVGAPGELCLGGRSVARDYLGRPGLTAERFVPDPFSAVPGARLYRTGDRVRWLASGELEFLGRTDRQVKVRGFRIEPGEIEARLREHPELREAVVVAREDAAGERRLVAYLVPAEHAAASEERVELWPSIGEHFVYDELIYQGLTSDERRHASYRVALERRVRGKVVVDVGTGAHAVLARMCVDAGARKVYAIEILEHAYEAAKRAIAAAGMEDRITLVHGNAMRVQLPEAADVCVSEIVEAIAGAEGAAPILNGVRRLLKEGGRFIPERNLTRIAAVSLPDALYERPAFTSVAAHYVERIFAEVGHPFNVRLCIKNFPQQN
ncbi:MAG TPA: amino acid adenylation domain-containing protein, partial [Longimicrobium sp.]|nr:amino acid adenylation domain-containing protein [Longimicrobium sp.]